MTKGELLQFTSRLQAHEEHCGTVLRRMSLNRTFAESNFQVAAKLTGKVVEIDATGNLVTDVSVEKLAGAPHDASLRIVVDEHETFGLFPLAHNQPAMTLVAVADKIGSVRIILVEDSASAMLGIRVGAPVEVHW